MTNYILSINENSKRGQLIKLLLAELSADRQAKIMSMEEYEKAEDKVIARHIKQGIKGASYTLAEAKNKIMELKKKAK